MLQELRFAARVLRKSPGFTMVAVLTLALGLGANTAIFAVVNATLLRPLPYKNPEAIVHISDRHSAEAFHLAGATFRDLRDQNRVFSAVAAYRVIPVNFSDNAEPERLQEAMVSADFFQVLAVRPLLGATFTDESFHQAAQGPVLLSYGVWQRRFASNAAVLGTSVLVQGEPRRIVGILPPGFDFPDSVGLWIPLAGEMALAENRRAHLFTVLARLRDGISLDQARANLQLLAQQIDQQNPGVDPGLNFTADRLHEHLVASSRPALLVLLGAVGLVLLIACVNVANLFLSRTAARQREFSIRTALGAGRVQLLRQVLAESLVIGTMSAVLGACFGFWSIKLLLAAYPEAVPLIGGLQLDLRVLAVIFVLAVLAAAVLAVVPVLQFARLGLSAALAEGARSSLSRRQHRVRSLLAVSEIAVALLLLISAGLLVKSLLRIEQVDPGYDPSHLLTMSVTLSDANYETFAQSTRFYDQVLDRIRRLPGVQLVAATNSMPNELYPDTDIDITGHPAAPGQELDAAILTATPDLFRTLPIPLLAGRNFTAQDVAGAPIVLIVNQTFVRHYLPGENPIGQRITMKDWGDPLDGEIVGVVGDVRQESLDVPPTPSIYYSLAQFDRGSLSTNLLVRTDVDPAALASAVRREIWSVDKAEPVADLAPMNLVLANSLRSRRFTLILMASFAGLAFLLSIVGIYGVMNSSVGSRRQEFAIRLALGAQQRDVLFMVCGEALRLAGAGLLVGVVAALASTRLLRSFLFGVGATDPLTFCSLAAALIVTALLASYVPARRATQVDPMVTLRAE
ncbi:MAG: ABC transporter permease [Acidobacteriia bacterium]|nr:ABC transporter permease [Terriglobia bacterium]